MSRYGEFRQVGMIVPDIRRALDYWIERCGVGPWFLAEQIRLESMSYMGESALIPFAAALAHSGETQLELIQPLDDTPSVFREFLRDTPEGGLQHFGIWAADYDATYAAMLADGLSVAQEGTTETGRFVYFRNPPGPMLELLEFGPARQGTFGQVREAARGWDGRDPIRPWPRTSS